MARLQNQNNPRLEARIGPDHLIGRKRRCDLVLQHPLVSSRHATLRWTERGWMLRDLGSRNGTWVNTRKLEPGEEVALRAGAVVVFGDASQAWVLLTDGAPEARAICGNAVVWSSGGVLALPSEEDPVAMVFPGIGGVWCAELPDRMVSLLDGDDLEVAGKHWTVELPGTVARTFGVAGQPGLADVTLDFKVSSDEEHVELVCHVGGTPRPLKARAHNYLLLTLARLKAQDADLDESERGWCHIEDLARMLRLEERPINVQVCRIRRQFATLKLRDAGDIVQRRVRHKLLRLGPVGVGRMG